MDQLGGIVSTRDALRPGGPFRRHELAAAPAPDLSIGVSYGVSPGTGHSVNAGEGRRHARLDSAGRAWQLRRLTGLADALAAGLRSRAGGVECRRSKPTLQLAFPGYAKSAEWLTDYHTNGRSTLRLSALDPL